MRERYLENNREDAESRTAGIFMRDTVAHSSLKHNESMPYPV